MKYPTILTATVASSFLVTQTEKASATNLQYIGAINLVAVSTNGGDTHQEMVVR